MKEKFLKKSDFKSIEKNVNIDKMIISINNNEDL